MRKIVVLASLLLLISVSLSQNLDTESPFKDLINQSAEKSTLLNGTRINGTVLQSINSQLKNSTVLDTVMIAFNNTRINLQLQYNKSSILEISIFFKDKEIKEVYFGVDPNAGKGDNVLIKLDIFKIERLASDWIAYLKKGEFNVFEGVKLTFSTQLIIWKMIIFGDIQVKPITALFKIVDIIQLIINLNQIMGQAQVPAIPV
jgi:hypothetical protein